MTSIIYDRPYETSSAYAKMCDENDPLRGYRDLFHIPQDQNGKDSLYFSGNSLGLMPKSAKNSVLKEIDEWAALGVKGYFKDPDPWVRFNENLRHDLAKLVGAHPHEVVAMNTLTVNLHLMMVSFYRPSNKRYKILMEASAFPSDRHAVDSQIKFHGFQVDDALIELKPRTGEYTIRQEDIEKTIRDHGDQIALVMIGAVNYYTGQLFDLKAISKAAREKGCLVGYDLAHAIGNVPIDLQDCDADFAVWCHYKYLNGGPACPGGAFVSEKYQNDTSLPRFTGWWGEDLEERFKMTPDFIPSRGAAGWQISNAGIFSLAPVRASLEIFSEAGMDNLRAKSIHLTGYMKYLLDKMNDGQFTIITPETSEMRGAQLSVIVHENGREIFDILCAENVVCDWRAPDVIRIAPVPLYNTYKDVFHFCKIFEKAISQNTAAAKTNQAASV